MIYNTPNLPQVHQCFTSSGQWADGSILPIHERESEGGYTRRKKGFCSPSVYRYLLDTYDILWAKGVARAGIDEVYMEFVSDCGMGLTLDAFLNRTFKLGEALGSCFIVMDSFKDQPATKEEMISQRTFPFMHYVMSQNVTQIEVDMVGRIKKFRFKLPESSGSAVEREYCVQNGCQDYDADGNRCGVCIPQDEMPVSMPVIPVVPSREPLISNEMPPSQTLGLYQQQFNMALTFSLMDESFYSQQYSILAISGNVDLQGMTLGTSNAMTLPQGATASFIAPSGTPIDKMIERIQQDLSMMQKTFANLITSGEAQSGTAKMIDRQVGAYQLINDANYLESLEYDIYSMFMQFMDESESENFKVMYFKEFDLSDLTSYIIQAGDMLALEISDRSKSEIKNKVISKFFADDPTLVQDLLIAEQSNEKTPSEPKDGEEGFVPLEDGLE